MKNINKSFIAAALATTLLSAPFAMAEKVLRIGHDNKAGIMENPAHAFTGVFKNIVETATNGEIKVQVFPSNQLAPPKSTFRWCETVSCRARLHL
nr:hypothetical protein [Enterovibrio nigricans]